MTRHYTSLATHLVFATKGGRRFIEEAFEERLHAYLGGIVDRELGTPLRIGGVEDHLHLLFELKPTVCVSDAVKSLKSNSSKWIHEDLRKPFEWQTGYGAFNVSRWNVPAVIDYINRQREHHAKFDFDTEFKKLLDSHGIAFDERYLLT